MAALRDTEARNGLAGKWVEGTRTAEQLTDKAELLSAGWRDPGDEIEYFAVLQAVIGDPFDRAGFTHVNGQDALIDHFRSFKGKPARFALADIVERFVAVGLITRC